MTDTHRRAHKRKIRKNIAESNKTGDENTKLLFVDEETGITCVLKDGVIHLIEARGIQDQQPERETAFERWHDWTGKHWTDRLY